MTERASVSTGVLDSFMTAALADDYSRSDLVAGDRPTRPGRVTRAAALFVAAGIGVLAVALIVSTVGGSAQRERTRTALANRVTAAGGNVSALQATVNAQQHHVSSLERDVLAAGDVAAGDGARADALAGIAGTTGAAGAGVVVTVDDAPNAEAGSTNRVLDRDLQDIVNALWREGATGIAINGHRLVATTAIRSAGEAIVVNYQPLSRPYRIDVLGARPAAESSSGVGRLLSHLGRDYGLVSDVVAAPVALPAGDWHDLRFATPQSSGASTPGGSP